MIIAKEDINCPSSPKLSRVGSKPLSLPQSVGQYVQEVANISQNRAQSVQEVANISQSSSLPQSEEQPTNRISRPVRVYKQFNIDTLNYIASQHDGECAFDSIQNILMFADGYREVNAQFAIEQYRKDSDSILNSRTRPTPELEYAIQTKYKFEQTLEMGRDNIIAFINFFAGALRRYILIKIKEFEETISTKPQLRRRASINLNAGKNLKYIGEGVCPNERYEIDIVSSFFKIINITIPFKDKFFTSSRYSTKKKDYIFIAGYIIVFPTIDEEDTSHALAIIRFKKDFYLVDNNIGKAIKINNIDKFDGNNFIMKFLNGTTEYYFGNYLIYKHGGHSSEDETFVQKQLESTYIYKTIAA